MRKLIRPRDGRMLAGVCAAVASYFKIDPTVVRLGAVVLAICTLGTAVLAYAAGWLLIPEEQDDYVAWNA
ncbi:PspC domain-containing protein [Actinobacteria bacterium YIM 96077]|uniref:PspC domain-containing protein n=1 Tax=Phytoactinopolyspora halophila TaxID=1981511 RepID=A0A329QG01_9ACTN|nr:PspC domain-containing protein [Phytoactinopolyspora halophila]AYY13068.1 PspC domain-containing protein [Actinobacteria bacterium YIM 96077]RAW09238.1 PspC domain-containing protein [Phytoactinopolyspora halophila]